MPTICVPADCSNQKDKAKGISLHVYPFLKTSDQRPRGEGKNGSIS